jgi:anti-sigma factor RsiW
MDCGAVIAWADSYVDRELPVGAAGQVFRHLSGCEMCTALVDEKTYIKNKVKASVNSAAVPARLIWDVHAALRKVTGAEHDF